MMFSPASFSKEFCRLRLPNKTKTTFSGSFFYNFQSVYVSTAQAGLASGRDQGEPQYERLGATQKGRTTQSLQGCVYFDDSMRRYIRDKPRPLTLEVVRNSFKDEVLSVRVEKSWKGCRQIGLTLHGTGVFSTKGASNSRQEFRLP